MGRGVFAGYVRLCLLVILTNIHLPVANTNLSSGASLNKVSFSLRISDNVNILNDILRYFGYFYSDPELS